MSFQLACKACSWLMLKLGIYFLIIWTFKLCGILLCDTVHLLNTAWPCGMPYFNWPSACCHCWQCAYCSVCMAVVLWRVWYCVYMISTCLWGHWSAVTCEVVCVITLCCTSPICFKHAYWITCILQSVVVLSDDVKQVFQAQGYSDSNLCKSFCHVPV